MGLIHIRETEILYLLKIKGLQNIPTISLRYTYNFYNCRSNISDYMNDIRKRSVENTHNIIIINYKTRNLMLLKILALHILHI